MTRLKSSLTLLLVVGLVAWGGCARLDRSSSGYALKDSQQDGFDLVIRNGKIIDGAGNGWFYGDVGVKDGRVESVGDLRGRKAIAEIDAGGLVIAPGFIDVHTHADRGLFDLPYAENFVRDGVTTVVTGNCGGSTRDIGEYFGRLKTKGVALNVATLVGHGSILREVKGNVATPLTAAQMEEAKAVVRQAMKDGAVGMSTGLIYTPGKYSPTEEIIELQKVAAEFGGIYATHMRSEGIEILEAIDEALRIGREARCRVEISHFKVARDNTFGGSATTLGKVLAARASGQEVWLDQYPYTASSTGISVLFPDWLMEGGRDEAEEILRDPVQLRRVLDDMKEYHEGKRHREDFAFAVISSSRAYPEYAGRSIKEVAQIQKLIAGGMSPEKALLAPAEQLPPVSMEDQYLAIVDIHLKGGAGCVYHSQAEEDVVNIMQSPLVAVCSDSGVREFGSGKPHPRGYGSNARVLGRYVREKGVLTLEDAIRKMTSLPAQAFQFKDRGLLREGYWADMTIFDPDTVIDRATFEDPHQYSEGIEYVIINGEVVLNRAELTGKLPGQPIYGPGK